MNNTRASNHTDDDSVYHIVRFTNNRIEPIRVSTLFNVEDDQWDTAIIVGDEIKLRVYYPSRDQAIGGHRALTIAVRQEFQSEGDFEEEAFYGGLYE